MGSRFENKIIEFLGDKVEFDEFGGKIIWAIGKDEEYQRLADLEIRGWAAIQNLFKTHKGEVNFESAEEFQDELGRWIADAINTKLQNSKK